MTRPPDDDLKDEFEIDHDVTPEEVQDFLIHRDEGFSESDYPDLDKED